MITDCFTAIEAQERSGNLPKDTGNRTHGQVLELPEKSNIKGDSTRMLREITSICVTPHFSGWSKASQTAMQEDPARAGHQEFPEEQQHRKIFSIYAKARL